MWKTFPYCLSMTFIREDSNGLNMYYYFLAAYNFIHLLGRTGGLEKNADIVKQELRDFLLGQQSLSDRF